MEEVSDAMHQNYVLHVRFIKLSSNIEYVYCCAVCTVHPRVKTIVNPVKSRGFLPSFVTSLAFVEPLRQCSLAYDPMMSCL